MNLSIVTSIKSIQESAFSLYARSPLWLQQLSLSAAGARVYQQRFAAPFPELFGEAMGLTWASRDQIKAVQEDHWRRVVRPSLASLDGYSREPIPLSALQELPVLTKEHLRAHMDDYLHPLRGSMGVVESHTSGTTGAGLRFVTTERAIKRQWAYWWRYRKWNGIPLDEWCGVFGGRTIVPPQQQEGPYWRVNYGGRTVMYSQYHMSPEHALLMLKDIQRRKLRWLHGYPSLLALLARVGIDAGMAGQVEVDWITIGAENLLSHQSELIHKMFGRRPLQHYGLAEGVANISECPEGRLHVDEDFSIVEFLPREDGGEGHRIVGTTLDNQAMPLLRYDTGDIAILPENPDEVCPCGRCGRIVSSIDGRKEDYLVLSDGSLVGRIDHLFKDAVAIAEAQVVQSRKGHACFRIVRSSGYSSRDEKALRQEIQSRFGARLLFDVEYLEALPRSRSGKLRLVLNEIEEAKNQ